MKIIMKKIQEYHPNRYAAQISKQQIKDDCGSKTNNSQMSKQSEISDGTSGSKTTPIKVVNTPWWHEIYKVNEFNCTSL